MKSKLLFHIWVLHAIFSYAFYYKFLSMTKSLSGVTVMLIA